MPNAHVRTRLIAAGVAGTLALAAVTPGFAASFPAATAGVKAAAGSDVIDVRWRGGPWIAGGVAAGLALGALAARPYYYGPGPYYYGPAPYYAPPPVAYEEPIYDAPGYAVPPGPVYAAPAAPNGPVRQCWVSTDRDKGAGYWRPC